MLPSQFMQLDPRERTLILALIERRGETMKKLKGGA